MNQNLDELYSKIEKIINVTILINPFFEDVKLNWESALIEHINTFILNKINK